MKRTESLPDLAEASLDGFRTITLRFTDLTPPLTPRQVVVRAATGTRLAIATVEPLRATADGRARAFAVKLTTPPDIAHPDIKIEVNGRAPRPVILGRVLSARRFYDAEARLGATYTPQATLFAVFAPNADAVDVVLAASPTGRKTTQHPMTRNPRGVWSATIDGDLRGKYYAYKLSGPAMASPGEAADIYATCAHFPHPRAMIADLAETEPAGFDATASVKLAAPPDAIVYEMHVRDFTIAPNSGAVQKGKYPALAEAGTALPGDPTVRTGLDHLVELGITHVQLMPIQESDNDDSAYDWGYMTAFFNTPEGWFASDPRGDARIRELKQAIHAFHQRGIGVVMDVVYNHTSPNASFDRIAPGYYYRLKKGGEYWNGSGCGNEFRSEQPMARKFILDSLKYWVSEFGIDGFRFDLMGLIDLKTLEMIRDELRAINPSILLYGEPWAAEPAGIRKVTHKDVIRGTGIAAFNDHFRDAIKGDRDGGAPGFVQTGERADGVRSGLLGSIHDWALHPTDVVTYCECHDNLTTWDKLVQTAPGASDEQKRRMQRLAGLLVLTAQGMPFLHSGQEFCRSKGGNPNTYNAPDDVNRLDWSRKKSNRGVFEYYRALIAIRKAHPVFRLRTREEVERRVRFLGHVPSDRLIACLLDGRQLPGETFSTTLVLLNGERVERAYELPPGRWLLNADADRAGEPALAAVSGRVVLPPHSGMLLHK